MNSVFFDKLIERHNLLDNYISLSVKSAFRKFYLDKKNKMYLAYIISVCTNIDINFIIEHLKYSDSKVQIISNMNIFVKNCSIIIKTLYNPVKDNIVNNQLISSFKKKHYITKIKFVYSDINQIIICNSKNSNKTYYINLRYIEKLYKSNKLLKRDMKLVLLIERNKNKLYSLYKNDSNMLDILKNLESYIEDKKFVLEYDYDVYKSKVN